MRDFLKRHRLEVWIFSVALVVRLALFGVIFTHNNHELIPTIHGDDGYYEISQGILHGHGFTWDTAEPFQPNPLRPPVWPFLIAFFARIFGSYWAVFAFEMLMACLIPVLAFRVVRKLFGQRVGKWTGFVMCFEPYLILFSFILYTETSFIFFFLISLLYFLKYLEKQTLRYAIWFGTFLGLATLIKPTIQYLPILIPIGLAFLWRKDLSRDLAKQCAAFLMVFAAIIAPWLYRNHVEFDSWSISAQPAYNLYVYLAPTVLAIDNHTSFDIEQAHVVRVDGFSDTASVTPATSEYYSGKALMVIKSHKAALVKSGLLSLVTFFTHDGMLTVLGYSGVRIENTLKVPALSLLAHPSELLSTLARYAFGPGALIILMRLFWVVVTLFFIFGSWRLLRERRVDPAILSLFFIILYFAATTAINGYGVNARFRMPVEVFILSFALYGLFSLKRDNTAVTKP